MHYKFRPVRYDRPGLDELFVLRFNVYGAEYMIQQLKRRRLIPRRTKHPAQAIVYQQRFYCR